MKSPKSQIEDWGPGSWIIVVETVCIKECEGLDLDAKTCRRENRRRRMCTSTPPLNKKKMRRVDEGV